MTYLRCREVGATARGLLIPGAGGRVLAGFSQAAYLATEQDELFWLADEGAPRHARAVLVARSLPRLGAGAAFDVADDHIIIDRGLQVDLRTATTWSMPPINAATSSRGEIAARLQRALAGLDLTLARGLGQLMPGTLALARGEQGAVPDGDPILERAWPAVRAMGQALLARDAAVLWREAEALVGLGEGLTPSGDDFLGGMLFALYTLERLYPETGLGLGAQGRFVASVEGRTHPISYVLLWDMAGGQAVEPLAAWVGAVCAGQPPERIRQLALELTCIGHSTGWDLLAGALAGLLLTPCALPAGPGRGP